MENQIASNVVEEAHRLLGRATEQGLMLRLLGGLAIRLHCENIPPLLQRDYPDLDFVGLSEQSGQLKRFFEQEGYDPRRKFNALHGKKRLVFEDPGHGRHVDIFLDNFEMCHKLYLRNRLPVDRLSIPLADLALTKLQIVKLNQKDANDLITLFLEHEVGPGDDETINGPYIAQLTSQDWGLYRTVTGSIEALKQYTESLDVEKKDVVNGCLKELLEAIEAAPKSLKWKLRAQVGERVQWYALPEDIAHPR